jgi:hypothetical protein
MLKRTQVLFEDWQVDYMKQAAERFDVSFSEVARILTSEAILSILFSLEPKKKITMSPSDLVKLKKKFLDQDTTTHERHQLLSDLYYEARKATEHGIGRP